MKTHPLSIRQAISFAWSSFKKRYRLFTTILLTIFGAWVVLEIVVIAGQRLGIWLWIAAHLAFLIFFAGIEVGFLQICNTLYDGGEPTFADTFKCLDLGPKFLVCQIIYFLIVVIGLALLIIPGLYLGARYALFSFCLATGETDLVRSFQQSTSLSLGAKRSLLTILISLLVLNLLGASVLGLGLFVTVPLSVLVMTAIYRQLSTR